VQVGVHVWVGVEVDGGEGGSLRDTVNSDGKTGVVCMLRGCGVGGRQVNYLGRREIRDRKPKNKNGLLLCADFGSWCLIVCVCVCVCFRVVRVCTHTHTTRTHTRTLTCTRPVRCDATMPPTPTH